MQLEDVTQIAVLGAGNMGHGIAEVAALAGYTVTMRDVEREYVEAGYESIEWSLERLEERGDLGEDAVERTLDRIDPVVDLEAAVGDADVIVEAVPEQRSIKADRNSARSKPMCTRPHLNTPPTTRSSFRTRRASRSPTSRPSPTVLTASAVCTFLTRRSGCHSSR